MGVLKGTLATVGHCCVDMSVEGLVPPPSALQVVGPLKWSTGGSMPNVGGVASRLGMDVIMVGQRGDDLLGRSMEDLLGEFNGKVILPVTSKSGTSYSIVLNRPGEDRAFMHDPGCNNTITALDIPYELFVALCDHIHFGYPTLMEKMYQDEGAQLEEVFRQFRKGSATTSLDMAMVNKDSPAAAAYWSYILRRTLRFVDLFMPSVDEIISLVYDFQGLDPKDPASWRLIAKTLCDWGAKVVVLKLGKLGLYAYTEGDLGLSGWGNQEELFSVPFKETKRVSTTGSGDAAIGGFLTAFCQKCSLSECLMMANAVSSCSVESSSATGGILSWERTLERLNGWEPFDFPLKKEEWQASSLNGVYSFVK